MSNIEHPSKAPTRITWLSINASYSHGSFALPCIHAAAGDLPGFEWSEVAATINDNAWGIVKRLVESEPDLVAATAYLFNRDVLLGALRRFAELRPDCMIVLGGPEFLGDNRAFLEARPYVTAVFRGEADLGFRQWLEGLNAPERIDGLRNGSGQIPDLRGQSGQIAVPAGHCRSGGSAAVPQRQDGPDLRWEVRYVDGLCRLDADGTYHDNGLAVVPEPLDRLPSPLTSAFYRTGKPFASLETCRGCPSACAFCTSCRLGPPRYLPLERVRTDLDRLKDAGVTEVRVLDRTFNLPAERCIQLLDLMRGFADTMRFHIEVNPAALTGDVLSALRSFPRGRLHIEAGLQTGNPEALHAISRGGDVARAWKGVRDLGSLAGVDTHVDLIAGLPCVTLNDIYSDLRRLCALGPAEIQLELLKILPGTPLRDSASELGLVYHREPPYEILRTPDMTFQNLDDVRRLSRAVDKFYNDAGLQEATRLATRQDETFWQRTARLGVDDRGEPVPISRKRRFRLLHESCSHLSNAAAALEYHWMVEGLGVRHGLVSAELWKDGIPSDAVCIAGDPDTAARRCRIWCCKIDDRQHWFAYTRERQQKHAAAVFRRG